MTDPERPRPDDDLLGRIRRHGARSLEMGPARDLLCPFDGGWYRRCVRCDAAIDGPDQLHYVERALRDGEPMFEFALCQACVREVGDELSDESMLRLGSFLLAHLDVDDRQERLEDADDAGPLVDRCLLSRRPRTELQEFQVWAWCRGPALVADAFAPAVVSGSMMEQLASGLSRQTRDSMDGFIRDHLGLPPELNKLPVLV